MSVELRRGPKRRGTSFFAHQLAEYAIAAALIASGLHVAGGLEGELVLVGSLLAALNLLSRGPLGAVKILGRHVHHFGDLVVIVVLAASPFRGFVRHNFADVLVCEAIALILIFIEQSTRYRADPASASIGPRPTTPFLSPRSRRAAYHIGVGAGLAQRIFRNVRTTSKRPHDDSAPGAQG